MGQVESKENKSADEEKEDYDQDAEGCYKIYVAFKKIFHFMRDLYIPVILFQPQI